MFLPDETVAQLTRERLADDCAKMKELLIGLLDSKGKVAEEIHALRKLGKSLRGGFALFRLEKSATLEIQAIGRLLSGPRDAVSRFQTWHKLDWTSDPLTASAIGFLLEQQTHSAARRPPLETIAWAVTRVNVALENLAALPAENLPKHITKGAAKLEKRLFSRCRKLSPSSEEHFHDARKAVKAWLGALRYLPPDTIHVVPCLKPTAVLLGDENDLATLSAWLEEHGFTEHFAPDLWTTIRIKRKSLQYEAIKNAEQLLKPDQALAQSAPTGNSL